MLQDLKILVIDDDEDDYFITSQYLEEIDTINISCNWSYNIKDALEKLISNEYDLYLLDYRLGAKTGLELMIQAIQNGAYKPIILLTGNGTREIDKLAVESGAYDYLIKSELSSEKLERCLRYAIERYKSFKLINDKEKKYRLIFENALSFIFTCDQLMFFADCNVASEYLLGLNPQELIGTSFFNLLNETDKVEFKKLLLSKKNIKNLQLKLNTKHGVKTGNVSLAYIAAEGLQAHWQGIMYDETIRVQAEQEKIQTEKLEATYRLVRTLAHEIRNPLTNIGLSLEGLMEKGMEESKMPYIDIIKRSSKRINDIISELLNSAKTIELKPELIDLNELLKEVILIAHDQIQLKNITCDIRLLDYPVIKVIDKEKLKIAIFNLIVNAIEAMDKEEKLLTISLEKNLDQTFLIIRDNGTGMTQEQLKKLFEPYFTTKKTGMGLGLVSTLNIIKSHKAVIEVQSEIGVGTTFKITFAG
jgi:PAS domain S-box-containing protein